MFNTILQQLQREITRTHHKNTLAATSLQKGCSFLMSTPAHKHSGLQTYREGVSIQPDRQVVAAVAVHSRPFEPVQPDILANAPQH